MLAHGIFNIVNLLSATRSSGEFGPIVSNFGAEIFTLQACHRPHDQAAIAKVFINTEILRKKSISLTIETSRRVWEVESYALSKFQPPTMLGDLQKVEKTIRKNLIFLGLGKQFFVIFAGFWRS